MRDESQESRDSLQRISISISGEIYRMLEELVEDAGYDNRSKAISDLITQASVNLREEHGDQVMAGTINIVFRTDKRGVVEKISATKTRNIAEVISAFQVLLLEGQVLEIMIVQGKPQVLKDIKDQLAAIKGVSSAHLTLTQAVIPPLHQPKNLPPQK